MNCLTKTGTRYYSSMLAVAILSSIPYEKVSVFLCTHDISKGVAGWFPPIDWAKLVGPLPACLDCVFARPDMPFVGAPKPQLFPVPLP